MYEMRDSVQSQLEMVKQKEEPCFLGELVQGDSKFSLRIPPQKKPRSQSSQRRSIDESSRVPCNVEQRRV